MMQNYSVAPKTLLLSLWQYRRLILSLVHREVVGRYRGSFLGILWSFFNPVFMLAVYTFVFSIIFKARWTVGSESKAEFALVLFAGLIIFNLFAECISRAPTLIQANTNYVKKVVFPLEILPIVVFGAAFFHAIISFAVWLIFSFFVFGVPHVTLLLFPVVLVPLTFLIMGLSWLLASLGVFLRDIAQVVGIVITTMMFLTPIFYPVSAIPEKYHPMIYSNPLTFIIEQARGLLIFGVSIDWMNLGLLTALTFFFSWCGFAWFQKTRKGFADVL
ncbi:MAG: ABC transporter permease [Desulfuromusa sp.]|nr:ABC transporter permease [Desulfuromusa sp.]